MEKVYVQDKNGKALDPTTPSRARKILAKGRAKVVERKPFTIKILDRKKENSYTKDVTLGIDAGYKKVGFSAINEDEELISGVLELRKNISKKLEQKSNYRRTRRSRNTKYRQPRFDNRKKEEGCLAPSIRHKLNSHIKLVNRLKEMLPITKVIIEVEHIPPKSRGVSNRVDNLAISCRECNQEKDNKTAKKFGYPNVQNKAKKNIKINCVYEYS